MIFTRYCCVFLLMIFSIFPQESLELKILVKGGESEKGVVLISLFDSDKNLMKEGVRTAQIPVDTEGQAHCLFKDLPPGIYAVSVAYDEDENGELNTNFLGIPTELVGFSNNAKGRFGPPKFEKTAFELKDDKSITIILGKAKD